MSDAAVMWALEQKVSDRLSHFLLVTIAAHQNHKTGKCFPSYARLADIVGCCRRTVIRKIKELAKAGLLKISANFSKGRQTTNSFEVGKSISSATEHKSSDDIMESPQTGNAVTPGSHSEGDAKGVTPFILKEKDKSSALSRGEISLSRKERVGCDRPAPSEEPSPEMRRKIKSEMAALVAKMRVGNPKRILNAYKGGN